MEPDVLDIQGYCKIPVDSTYPTWRFWSRVKERAEGAGFGVSLDYSVAHEGMPGIRIYSYDTDSLIVFSLSASKAKSMSDEQLDEYIEGLKWRTTF